MVNAQEWLDREYPKEGRIEKDWQGKDKKITRSKVYEIYLNEPGLEGVLDLRDFTCWNLKVYISSQADETKLTFINKPKGAEIIPIVSQRYLNYHYLKEQRSEITLLKISQKNLEGELDLSDFINLKELDCFYNKLVSLNVSNCSQLEKISCTNNLLTNITLPTNPTNLKYLYLGNNNFPPQDLSFLVSCSNLEKLGLGNYINQVIYNRFTGSLDYLSGMKNLKELLIDNTDINEVNIDKLPRSLERIRYSTKGRPSCKLTKIVPLLKEYNEWGWCKKCQQWNTSKNWCQFCAEKEWKQLTGQKLVERFIQQQKERNKYSRLQLISYEQFTNIEYLSKGGFSKIYRAEWKECKDYLNKEKIIVLKSLDNSQNITLEFLTEIANTKLVDNGRIVQCYGLSQDPQTRNYLMVMEYINGGNLREYLQNKIGELSLKDKIERLENIAKGLKEIHQQNLVHRDLHSGNILNKILKSMFDNMFQSFITDLGFSQPANYQKQEGQIFGVLPYVAPEVLRGQPYTKASDVYSFGIVAYELLVNAYPYYECGNDEFLAVSICQGLRPNIDKVPIPKLLKNLIKRCWSVNLEERPSAEELYKIIEELGHKKAGQEYNTFFLNTPYRINPKTIIVSKLIDTNEITRRLNELGLSEKLNIQKSKEIFFKESEEIAPIEIKNTGLTQEIGEFSVRTKRQLSLTSQNEPLPQSKSNKLTELIEIISIEDKQEYSFEPMEIEYTQNQDWRNIHPYFTSRLISSWQNLGFTYSQTQDWINIGLQPTDYNFCAWLRDNKNYTSEQVLNHNNLEQLNQEFFTYWQEQQQSNIEVLPK